MTRFLSKTAACLIFVLYAAASCSTNGSNTCIPADKAIEGKIEKLLKGMSLKEKAGQMVQITISVIENEQRDGLDTAKMDELFGEYKVGSILNVAQDHCQTRERTAELVRQIQAKSMEHIGIPCIYGLDMIHGASYLTDGSLYPQEINIAATFDRRYAAMMGEATAYESRAAQVPWVFSPVMDLGRDPRWPRIWESWGEDPYLQAEMARTEVEAMQGPDPNHVDAEHVATSIKHFMGYGVPFTGKDRTPAYIPENDLKEKYFRPFKECFQAGALTMMVNSSSINGIPTHANKTLLTGWVKEGLGWDGMVVTDWADIDNLYQRDHVAADRREALKLGINAGIDMVMDPYDPECVNDIVALAESGDIPLSRIDDAVRRILRLKMRLGLFDSPVWDRDYPLFASERFAEESYRAAVESEVLLKNEGGLLPLSGSERLLVVGPNANSLRTLGGGWSYSWQGDADAYAPQYNTILEALQARFKHVTYYQCIGLDSKKFAWQAEYPDKAEYERAAAAAANADVVICCVGENTYCESPGNIDDLNLSAPQKELVRTVAAAGKPLVLVLNEGRPRIIGDIEPLAAAVVDVMLPSNYGGDALSALLTGEENFSGRLPFTYPKHINSLHTYDYKVCEHREMMEGAYNYDAVMDVQWPFGHGLSYTSFEYSDLTVEVPDGFTADDTLEVSVKVTNTGGREGKEAVLLYSSDLIASLIPDVRRLRGFEKVSLAAGESTTVHFSIPARELAFVGADGRWRLEEGEFRISCGGLGQIVRCGVTELWD